MSEEEDRTRHDERSQEITTGIGKQEQFDDTAINKLFVVSKNINLLIIH